MMWSSLPPHLLCLVFLVLSPPSSHATFPGRNSLSSPNSPFHAIEILDPRKQVDNQDPICCLVPLPPVPDEKPEGKDADEEVMLLSFEEWKEKMFRAQEKSKAEKSKELEDDEAQDLASTSHPVVDENEVPLSSPEIVKQDEEKVPSVPSSKLPMDISPHFRVPITDRFNYASTDCSARVHGSHKSAKSASSILSAKKDRYMLSPCTSKANEVQHVVVELCDDIRIDTVQLANFEFFSGVFKDFEVSVAKTFTTDPSGWISAGIYRAKNVRSVQSFHPPSTMKDFYRYIRIDFLSHYGSEYYCPISLLRVYGLTHLELWKWEKWEEEFLEKQAEKAKIEQQAIPVEVDKTDMASHLEESPSEATPSQPSPSSHLASTVAPGTTSSSATPLTEEPLDGNETTTIRTVDPGMQEVASNSSTSESPTSTTITSNVDGSISLSAEEVASSSTAVGSPSLEPTLVPPLSSPSSDTPSTAIASQSQTHTSFRSSTTTYTIIASPTATTSLSTTGGESIYKLIMTKLAMLESNQSREREIGEEYRRYFEDQMGGVRSVLRRLTEEQGRMETLTKSQAASFSRSIADWEKERRDLQIQYSRLVDRIDWLTDEIILEKRLGIAQLCLLITVLIFLALTRGGVSQPIPILHRRTRSSGEWMNGIRKSLSWRNWNVGRGPPDEKMTEAKISPVTSRNFPPTATLTPATRHVQTPTSRRNDLDFPTTSSQAPTYSTATPSVAPSRLQRATPVSASRVPHHHHVGTPVHLVRAPRPRTPSLRSTKGLRSRTPVTPRRMPLVSATNHTADLSKNGNLFLSSPMTLQDTHSSPSKSRRGGPKLARSASSTPRLFADDGNHPATGHPTKKGRIAHLHEVTSPTRRGQGEGFEIESVESSSLARRRRRKGENEEGTGMDFMSELFDRADGVFKPGQRKKRREGYENGHDADVEGEDDGNGSDMWVTDSMAGEWLSD